jgi:hypothetical protein
MNSTGTVIIVGAPYYNTNNGYTVIYTYNNIGNYWNNSNILINPAPGSIKYFGYSVGINSAGTTAIVGAYDSINNVAWTEIYTSNISLGTWNSSTYLKNPIATVAQLGVSVAINSTGTVAIVGEFTTNTNLGWTGIYTSNISLGTWSNAIPLTNPGVSNFGTSVSLNDAGTVAIVGASNYISGIGWAGIYTSNISLGTWNTTPTILTNSLIGITYFGYSVAINSAGTVAIVGASNYNSGIGWAGIYTSNISNGTWSSATALTNPFSSGTPLFGSSVKINSAGTTAIIGAYGYSSTLGWAGIYTSNISTNTWSNVTALTNPVSSTSNFGNSVAINSAGTAAIVGAYGTSTSIGAAYTYVINSAGSGYQGIVAIAYPQPTTITILNNNSNIILSQITPTNPTQITGSIYSTYATLTWQPSPNATYYVVTSTPTTTSQTTYQSSIIFTGLTSGTSYTFTITPYNSQNIAGNSITYTYTILYTFANATFTPGTATGINGPTLAVAQAGITGTPTPSTWYSSYLAMTTQGFMKWTVPITGTYTFLVVGAHGAMGTTSTTGSRAGRGAYLQGIVALTQGQIVRIVVGQGGSHDTNNGGGGGASYIYNETTSTLLFIAGGGGGTRQAATLNGYDASTATNGTCANSASDSTSGVVNNNTTFTYNSTTATLGNGGIAGMPSNYGDGGAGWLGNGNDDGTVSTVATSLSTTALGGGSGQGGAGGFGGGGSGAGGNGGGGGGGYTGGNGGYMAGGGGSYINTAIVTSYSYAVDTARSSTLNGPVVNGYITITKN